MAPAPKPDAGPSDEELMRAYRKGDAEAFEALYGRYERRLFTFLVRMVGERGVAEELFQETFARVVTGRVRWKPKAAFSSWVYRIARNLALDHLKSHGHTRTAPMAEGKDGTDGADTFASGAPSPEARASNAEARERLARAIAALPAAQREVLTMRQSGLSFVEIADAIGHSQSTVKSQMRYALGHLRKALETEGVDREAALGDG